LPPWTGSTRRLGVAAEALLRRCCGSPEDARHELEELDRTGRLQAGLARPLRLELGTAGGLAEQPPGSRRAGAEGGRDETRHGRGPENRAALEGGSAGSAPREEEIPR
jgi:hypothetical protein